MASKIKPKYKNKVFGASCLFYIRLTEKFSIKLYGNKQERDEILYKQRVAHVCGIAPQSLCKVKVKKYYGYITEHADTKTGLTLGQLDELLYKMHKLGFCTGDLGAYWNSGLINGKPVCIDFDSASVGSGNTKKLKLRKKNGSKSGSKSSSNRS